LKGNLSEAATKQLEIVAGGLLMGWLVFSHWQLWYKTVVGLVMTYFIWKLHRLGYVP